MRPCPYWVWANDSRFRDTACLRGGCRSQRRILLYAEAGEKGIRFISENLIEPKFQYFETDYTFNSDGTFIKSARNITERASGEFDRIKRISLESLDDYHDKENRNLKPDLSTVEKTQVANIIQMVKNSQFREAFSALKSLMKDIQNRELTTLK